MRWTHKLGIVALSFALVASATAQGHGHHNGGNGGNSGGSSNGATRGGATTPGAHRSISNGPSSPYVNPFQQQTHIVTQGSGCYGCGYSTYGGYVYGGYDG